MKQILVTDTLFIFEEHEKALKDRGYEVKSISKPDSSEKELIEAVKDVDGYILGGIEYVTEPVIEAANRLRAIVFTGTGFKGHIPAWELAKSKGIKIGNTPYANVYEVAEWGVAATLAMQRNLFALGPRGDEKFSTIISLPDLKIGILGFGHIGEKYANMMNSLGAKEVTYWSRRDKNSVYKLKTKEELFKESDIIFVSVGDDAGENFVSKRELDLMKKNSLLVSISHHGIINESELSSALNNGKIRAAVDIVKDHGLFQVLAADRWYGSNASAAYNSTGYLKRSSDMAMETIVNLLESGEDKNRVV